MTEIVLPKFVDESFENKALDISHEEYHLMRDHVHSSSLLHVLKSPHAFMHYAKYPKQPTKQMKFGTIAHGVILEGQKYLDKFQVLPIFKGLTKEGKETTSMAANSVKEQYQEWISSLPAGTEIMTQEDHDKLMFMLDSMLNHKFVMEVIKDGFPEYKKQWRDPIAGLACVSSDDFVSFKNDIWLDVKTTQESEWEKFRPTVERLNYPFQAAHYARGNKIVHNFDPRHRFWIAIESGGNYECRVHPISPYYQEAGERDVRVAMRDLSISIKNNSWPQGQFVLEDGEPSSFYKYKYDPILAEES